MKIFITGATGFIGTHLVNRLFQTDHELVCLVRKYNHKSELLEKRGAKLVIGNILDKDSLMQGMKGCDWVMHLAGLYDFWIPKKRLYKDINITGTTNVMESALENNISKIVHVSTVGTFGVPEDSPFTEKSKPGIPIGRYFQTKSEGERIVWELHKKKNLPVVMINPCAVIGPGDTKATAEFFSRIIHRQLPANVFVNTVFTYVYVKDVAEGIIKAAEKEDNIGEKYLLGKYQASNREMSKMVSDISGVPLPGMNMPDFMTLMNAYLLTGIANLIKKPPVWGMAADHMKVLKKGFKADGSKAERDLGVTYTPIRQALEEYIASVQ